MSERCNRCGRTLKNPQAIEIGMGKICAAKAEWERTITQTIQENEMRLENDNQETIVMKRTNDRACTNIPFYSKQAGIPLHSPNGFEWGYGGSGPSELSKNVLYHVTKDWSFSEKHYQDFKWEFIAKMPEIGGSLRVKEIQAWVAQRH